MAEESQNNSLTSAAAWASFAVFLWCASYLVSEVSKEKYTEILTPCLPASVMHEECKEIMSDKKMTNFEYLVFKNELAEKEQEAAASNVLNKTNGSAPGGDDV